MHGKGRAGIRVQYLHALQSKDVAEDKNLAEQATGMSRSGILDARDQKDPWTRSVFSFHQR